jgi:NADH-quinone oxidoreductase subunit N
MKFFLLGGLTNAFMLVGIVLLFGLLGSTTYAAFSVPAGNDGSYALLLALAFISVGVCFKLAAVPAHSWMPDVAEGAPAPSAAFLTVVPKIGAAVALARLVALLPEIMAWRTLVAILAVATMTVGNLAALWQRDLRRMLGWSAVSQSGYALVGVSAVGLSGQALPALLYFLGGYAAATLAAFGAVTGLRGRTRLHDFRGLAAVRPWLAGVLTLSFLSLVGIPPLVGFVGKFLLILAAVDSGYAWLAVALILNTVLSLWYYLRFVGPMYFESPSPNVATLSRGTVAVALTVGASLPLLGLAAGLVLPRLQDLLLLP